MNSLQFKMWALAVGAVCPGLVLAASASDRLVHRYLDVKISPDAAWVASIEGDSPVGGFYPPLRDLVIRTAVGERKGGRGAATEVRVALPCGRVPQCWPGHLAWAPDGRHLSFTLRTPGSHSYSVYSVARDGGSPTRLLEFNGTLADLKYSADGQLAMLATADARKEAGATEAGAPIAGDLDTPPAEQRIATLENGELRWASPADLYVYEFDWRPGNAGFVGTAAPGDGDNNWWIAKLYAFGAGAAKLLYAPPDARHQIANPVVSPDGGTIAFISGIMSDFGSTGGDVYSLPSAGGAATNVTPDIKASAVSLAWSCKGGLRAELLVGGEAQVTDLGTARAATAPRVLWRGAETLHSGDGGMTFSCPGDVLAVSHESYTSPPEIQVGGLGRLRDLTHVNAGLTIPLKAVNLTWENDGFTVQGWLLLPERTGAPDARIPMVTIVHGGPASAATPYFQGPGLQRKLIERGWAVFRPNPRGSYGQGERFTAANVRDFGHGDLRDIMAGIDAAARVAPIDTARLGLTGGSYGGFMTMWAVTQTARFKAAVADAGISNWLSYYGENGIDGWMIPYFGASAYEDPEIYAKSSAINYIRQVHTPTFAYVGERDIECPAAQTQEFWHAMKAVGAPTAVMIYPGEGHAIRDPQHSSDALERTLAWFDRYLK